MTEGRGSQEPQFAAFVGIDWADQKHAWCLQAADSGKRESGELEHKVETVANRQSHPRFAHPSL